MLYKANPRELNLFESSLSRIFPADQQRSAGDFFYPAFPFIGTKTEAGAKVNHNTSYKIAAFWCGVNTIANSVAMLPKRIYQEMDNSKNPVQHPANFIIHNEPNPWMSANDFWIALIQMAIVRGDGFAGIVRDGNGFPVALELWQFDDVSIFADQNGIYYKNRQYGGKIFLADEVFHITGFGFNGIRGRGVVSYAADNMGMALAADEFAANTYNDRGISYSVIETEKSVKDVGKRNIRKLIKQDLQEVGAHKVAVLDEGMKHKSIALKPQESQFIEAKATGVEDIARWLNIPLHKLHTKGEGGYNFLVQMSIEYLQSAVMPWGQKIKEETQRKLLTRAEKESGYYCFVNYRKLLEADPKSRAEYYKTMVFIKSMVPNEVRAMEDLNPIADGDQPLQMANMLTPEQIKKELSNAE